MSDLYVIGIDPGPSTGMFITRNGRKFGVYQGSPIIALESLALLLEELNGDGARVHVACERYVSSGQPNRTHQSVPQQVIGSVLTIVERHGFPVSIQNPSDAKRIAPNDLLRSLGFYVMRGDVECRDANDVNDAARHAVLLLMTNYATVLEARLNALP